MSFERKELSGALQTQPPKTMTGTTRTCGKCGARRPASGAGGKKHRVFGWIGACCAGEK